MIAFIVAASVSQAEPAPLPPTLGPAQATIRVPASQLEPEPLPPPVQKAELYRRARIWFSTEFVSGESVIDMEDAEAGIIIGNVSLPFTSALYAFGSTAGTLRYSVRVDVKDGTYSVRFSNERHEASRYSSSFGAIREGHCPIAIQFEMLPTERKRNEAKVWCMEVMAEMARRVRYHQQGLNESIDKAMLRSTAW